jgi:hypothetical protein
MNSLRLDLPRVQITRSPSALLEITAWLANFLTKMLGVITSSRVDTELMKFSDSVFSASPGLLQPPDYLRQARFVVVSNSLS